MQQQIFLSHFACYIQSWRYVNNATNEISEAFIQQSYHLFLYLFPSCRGYLWSVLSPLFGGIWRRLYHAGLTEQAPTPQYRKRNSKLIRKQVHINHQWLRFDCINSKANDLRLWHSLYLVNTITSKPNNTTSKSVHSYIAPKTLMIYV